jgi:hypothetical protein
VRFVLLEYLLLFQGKEQGLNGIPRAGLSVLVTGRAIAAIFAGETGRYPEESLFSGKQASLFLVEWAVYAGFCKRLMQEWRKRAPNKSNNVFLSILRLEPNSYVC